jgi:hypothetical protein
MIWMRWHELNFAGAKCFSVVSYFCNVMIILCLHLCSKSRWYDMKILSRVRGSVTNNTGFWIGWLDWHLLCTINYNGSQTIFSRTLLPLLRRTRPILVLVRWLTPTELRWLLYPLGTDRAQKTQLFYCCLHLCWGSHVIFTQPVHWRAGCCLATVSVRTT